MKVEIRRRKDKSVKFSVIKLKQRCESEFLKSLTSEHFHLTPIILNVM